MADTLVIMRTEEEDPSARGVGVTDKFRRLERARRAPRTDAYMHQLVHDVLGPDHELAVLQRGTDPNAQLRLYAAGDHMRVVLLWPDAIGSGWSAIEKNVRTMMAPKARLFALNGRRRFFELDRKTLAGMRMRRVVEHMWMGEMVFAIGLLFVAPILVAWDLARGRS